MASVYEIESKLRACPLCGGRAGYRVGDESRDTSSWYYIRCQNSTCGCGISVNLSGYQPDYAQQHQAFLDRWNNRTADTAECEGYNQEQLRTVATMLIENEIEPDEFREIWRLFKSVVDVVKTAADRKWTKAIDGLINRSEK